MSRIKLIEKEQADLKIKELFQKIEDGGFEVLNMYKVAAHSPQVASRLIGLGNKLMNTTELSPKLRELAILRIAKKCKSEYEWTHHSQVAPKMEITKEQIESIDHWGEAGVFSEEEQAILKYVDEVESNDKISEATFQTLKEYLSEREIAELTISIGYWHLIARLTAALEVEVE